MVEYGQGVGQAGQIAGGSGHASTSGPTDIGASIGASAMDALNHTSAALGVPPGLLAAAILVLVIFVGWFVFAR